MLGKDPQRDQAIENICQMIRNTGKAGIPMAKYNLSFLGVPRTGSTIGRGGARDSTFVYDKLDPNAPLTEAGVVTEEIYWDRSSRELPAFFRDSLVQYVARTYYFDRDNFDGTKSQTWAAGGWLAFGVVMVGWALAYWPPWVAIINKLLLVAIGIFISLPIRSLDALSLQKRLDDIGRSQRGREGT